MSTQYAGQDFPRCGRLKANGKPCMRRMSPCSEHTTPEEARARLEWATGEALRQDVAVQEWLGTVTQGRPSFSEAEPLLLQGIPSCYLWAVPSGPPPPHLDAIGALRKWQAGTCAICSSTGVRLLVDHCHRTGLIRGLLCNGCNTAEGLSGAAVYAAYRQRPPAVMLQVSAQYGSPWDGFGA